MRCWNKLAKTTRINLVIFLDTNCCRALWEAFKNLRIRSIINISLQTRSKPTEQRRLKIKTINFIFL